MENVSVPQLAIEDFIKNANNPFKKTKRWHRIRCRLCNEVVLGRAVTNQKDWEKIREHLKIRHSIVVDREVPVRLLSLRLFKIWLKKEFGDVLKK